MMCANYAHLETEVKKLEEGGIDSFHIDIMDGPRIEKNIINARQHFLTALSSNFCKYKVNFIRYFGEKTLS